MLRLPQLHSHDQNSHAHLDQPPLGRRARDAQIVAEEKPRKRRGPEPAAGDEDSTLHHPLLGEGPTLQLMDEGGAAGSGRSLRRVGAPHAERPWDKVLAWLPGSKNKKPMATTIPQVRR